VDRIRRALRQLTGRTVGRFVVIVEPEGWQFEAVAGVSLVESARRAGIVLPTSCRNGTCRTCRCQVISGRVRHLIEWPGLSEEERLDGAILPCVATAESPLRIEAPRAFQWPAPVAPRPDAS
jgi:ferredoxin